MPQKQQEDLRLALALGAGYVRIGCGESESVSQNPAQFTYAHIFLYIHLYIGVYIQIENTKNAMWTCLCVCVFFVSLSVQMISNPLSDKNWENKTHSHPKCLNATISILYSLFTFDPSKRTEPNEAHEWVSVRVSFFFFYLLFHSVMECEKELEFVLLFDDDGEKRTTKETNET